MRATSLSFRSSSALNASNQIVTHSDSDDELQDGTLLSPSSLDVVKVKVMKYQPSVQQSDSESSKETAESTLRQKIT